MGCFSFNGNKIISTGGGGGPPGGGGNNVQNAVSRLNDVKAGVYVTATAGAFGALPTFVSGLRSLGNNTPILNSSVTSRRACTPSKDRDTEEARSVSPGLLVVSSLLVSGK